MEIDYSLIPGRELKRQQFEKDNKAIVSIITPYYNDSKYIDNTVNCILNQTFPYFEWIIVNDGSTNEEDINKLDSLEKLDSRIKIFHKENEGPAAARDFGARQISKSSKYIVFRCR